MRSELDLGEFLAEMLGAVCAVQLRSVWSWLLLVEDRVPVDLCEPWVGHDLFGVGGT